MSTTGQTQISTCSAPVVCWVTCNVYAGGCVLLQRQRHLRQVSCAVRIQLHDVQHTSRNTASFCRQLLVPEQASSPLRMSTEDSPHHLVSPKQKCIGGSSRNRRGARDASRKGGLRAGSDHFSFGAMKRHNIFNGSGDSNIVLSVSGEWAAGGHNHQQPDMKLPSNIVGDCDVCE